LTKKSNGEGQGYCIFCDGSPSIQASDVTDSFLTLALGILAMSWKERVCLHVLVKQLVLWPISCLALRIAVHGFSALTAIFQRLTFGIAVPAMVLQPLNWEDRSIVSTVLSVNFQTL